MIVRGLVENLIHANIFYVVINDTSPSRSLPECGYNLGKRENYFP